MSHPNDAACIIANAKICAAAARCAGYAAENQRAQNQPISYGQSWFEEQAQNMEDAIKELQDATPKA